MLPRVRYAIGTGTLGSLVSHELADALETMSARLEQELAEGPLGFRASFAESLAT